MVKRNEYLEKLIALKDNAQVKVITGIRRSGKSYLLHLFRDYLEQSDVSENQVIYINFESLEHVGLTKGLALYSYLKKEFGNSKRRLYFLFDEIQEVENWQKTINSLRVDFDCDIYLTGSNASLLSGELATYLTGRTISISIFPLSFDEFLSFKELKEIDLAQDSSLLSEYERFGGFPAVVLVENLQIKEAMLSEISENILFRDIAVRGRMADYEVLRNVINYLLDNIGQPISLQNIVNTLASANISSTLKTVSRLLDLLENAFIFTACNRYDLRGKKRLVKTPKYYVSDLGLRNQLLGSFAGNRGGQLENLVFNTLKTRGYELYTGRNGDKEIDFVALKNGQTTYIQVAYQLPDNAHETDNLLAIRDGYKKIVITQNWEDVGTIDGIRIIHVTDFLIHDLGDF